MAAPGSNAEGKAARAKLPLIAGVSLFALIAATGAGVTLWGDPYAGEPEARLALEGSASTQPEHAAGGKPNPVLTASADAAPEATLGPITKPVYAGRALLADPALIENTANGPLPRIADDGRIPMQAYAGANMSAGRPRIAIVITGLGLGAKATAAAISGLPASVTLGLAPYAPDIQRWAQDARMRGHEILLELPMEPFDYPDSDPGPHTLRSGLGESTNTQHLAWALTRFTGYAGVTNLGNGARFMSDGHSLAPVMTFVTRRGLLFFDNGAAAQSAAPTVAQQAGTSFARASITIDSIQEATEIDRRLSELETEARTRGSAVGAGRLYPVTVDRVAQWAKGLSGRGFVLVPASAIVTAQKK